MFAPISFSPLLVSAVTVALGVSAIAHRNGDKVPDVIVAEASAGAALVSANTTPAIAVEGAASHAAQRASDGLFYVNAVVNGKSLRFLVDTGATVVVLTAADAQAAGISLQDSHYNANVDTVGGSTSMAWTQIDQFSLGTRKVYNLKAAVVRNGLGVSLLGQNALAQLGPVTIEGDRISWRSLPR